MFRRRTENNSRKKYSQLHVNHFIEVCTFRPKIFHQSFWTRCKAHPFEAFLVVYVPSLFLTSLFFCRPVSCPLLCSPFVMDTRAVRRLAFTKWALLFTTTLTRDGLICNWFFLLLSGSSASHHLFSFAIDTFVSFLFLFEKGLSSFPELFETAPENSSTRGNQILQLPDSITNVTQGLPFLSRYLKWQIFFTNLTSTLLEWNVSVF